jgi:hypothetical protein
MSRLGRVLPEELVRETVSLPLLQDQPEIVRLAVMLYIRPCLGPQPHCLPTDPARITPRYWIAEIVYFPIETALLAVLGPKAVLPCPVGNGGVSSGSGVSPFMGQAPDTARMQAHFTTLTG